MMIFFPVRSKQIEFPLAKIVGDFERHREGQPGTCSANELGRGGGFRRTETCRKCIEVSKIMIC